MSRCTNRTEIEQILQADRVWSAYALADLEPQFDRYCRWFPVCREGLVLLFEAFSPTVIFAAGSAQVVAEALAGVPLPERVSLHVRAYHLPLLARHYDCGDDLWPMLRLRLADPAAAARYARSAPVRLERRDAPRNERRPAERHSPQAVRAAGLWNLLLVLGRHRLVETLCRRRHEDELAHQRIN